MKKLLLVLAAFPIYASASCQDKIKSDKFMLFIDTNESEKEIETAEKAACARGEKFVVVPQNYLDHKPYREKVEKAKKAAVDCAKKNKGNEIVCQDATQAFRKAYDEQLAFVRSQPSIKKGTEAALKDIQSKKGKLDNVLISGHDGGGQFGGAKGNFGRDDLAQMIGKFSDINEVSTVMLLGCYTGVQKEIIEWKNIFPKIRMIAGYDDAAPLSDKPAGHQYISEILGKEKQLIEQADQKKLQNYARANIKSLTLLHAAVYVNCNDGTDPEGSEYYFSSKNRSKHFSEFGAKECKEKEQEFNDIIASVRPFASGEKEPPTDTRSGELRQIYIKARNMEHCADFLDKTINVHEIFNLLFHEGVKHSFTAFYQADLAAAEKAINDLKTKYPKYLQDVWVPTAENLAKHSRKEILSNIHRIHGILANSDLKDADKKALGWVAGISSRHFQHFQHPFSWHEHISGVPERPRYAQALANFSFNEYRNELRMNGNWRPTSGGERGPDEEAGILTRLLNLIRD